MIAFLEILKEEENSFYWVNVECSNCGLKNSVAIIKNNKISEVRCPKCHNKTLSLVK